MKSLRGVKIPKSLNDLCWHVHRLGNPTRVTNCLTASTVEQSSLITCTSSIDFECPTKFAFCTNCTGRNSTVRINPRLSDLKGPETSKLDWRYLEHNKIDRHELQIRTNSQKGTGTKIAEKLNNFEKFERKKRSNFSPVLHPQTS